MSQAFAKPLPKGSNLLAVLFVAVLFSALAVIYCAHLHRQLLNGLYAQLNTRDQLEAEWGRLVLEQSTWTAYSRVEQLAVQQAGMRIPQAQEIQLVAP